jgi:hypothetical protein
MVGLLETPKLTNISYKLLYSNIGCQWERTWNNVFILTIFQFFSPINLFALAKIDLGPLHKYNFIFFKWIHSIAMYSPPFFTPNLGKSHTTILQSKMFFQSIPFFNNLVHVLNWGAKFNPKFHIMYKPTLCHYTL